MVRFALYRVLVSLAGALLLAAFVARRSGPELLAATAGAVALALFLARSRRGGWVALRLLLHIVALLAAAGFEWRARPPVLPDALVHALADSAEDALWVGRVTGIPAPTPEGTEVVLALAGRLAAPGAAERIVATGGHALVRCPGPAAPEPGEWWLVRGRFVRPPPRRNPGGFDPRARAARLGIAGRIEVARAGAARRLARRPPAAARPDLALAALIAELRARGHRALAARLRPETAGLAEAMSLGMRGSLDPETNGTFRVLGWSHLIAVSGLNVGFVAGLGAALLHVARVRRRGPALAFLMVAYAVATGGEAPVVRAAMMGLAALAARAAGRSLATARSLALAALLGLAAAPRWLGDPGFQLSFAAIAGMALLGPRLDWAHPLAWLAGRGWFARTIGLPLWAGVTAQLGCLPILATTFHAVSVWGVVTGPIAVPLSGVFVSALLLGLALLGVPGPFGDGCLAGSAVLGEALLAMSRLGARHLSAPWPMPAPGPVAIAVFVLALLLASLTTRRALRIAGAVLAFGMTVVIIAGLPAAPGPPERVDLIFLDVGQGDAALIIAHGPPGPAGRLGFKRRPSAVIVVDAGDYPAGGFDAGAGIVAPALAAVGARGVDAFIATHGDRDHVGGLPGLARAMPIREIFWPAPYHAPPALAALTARRNGPHLRPVAAGDTLVRRPGLLFVAVHPPRDYGGDENDGSLVVLLEAAGRRALFSGDIETPGESVLCGSRQQLAVDLVKVAHHGSSTSSTPELIAATDPAHAIVSVGARNRFGHPAPDVLGRWAEAGAEVWRTDRGGAVIATLSGGPALVRSFAPVD